MATPTAAQMAIPTATAVVVTEVVMVAAVTAVEVVQVVQVVTACPTWARV